MQDFGKNPIGCLMRVMHAGAGGRRAGYGRGGDQGEYAGDCRGLAQEDMLVKVGISHLLSCL